MEFESSVNIPSEEISEDERLVLRGDAVGETSYSAKYILKTLMSLSKLPDEVKWSSELETDLCYLWDMAVNKDVVSFLIENEFLSIAEYVLSVSTSNRLTEITVGIIGNLCCETEVVRQIAEKEDFVALILNLLRSDDPETIIQTVRILKSVMWNLACEESCIKWWQHLIDCKFLGETLTFILKSSTNETLLMGTVNLGKLIGFAESDHDDVMLFPQIFEAKPLYLALLEVFDQLIPAEESNEILTSKQITTVEGWLTILMTILDGAGEHVHDIIEDHTPVITKLARIIRPYQTRDNFKMYALKDDILMSNIHHAVQVIIWFQRHGYVVDTGMICIILEILYLLRNLKTYQPNTCHKNNRVVQLKGLILKYWHTILSVAPESDMEEIFDVCPEHTVNYLRELKIRKAGMDLWMNTYYGA